MRHPKVFVTHATPNIKASLAAASRFGDVVFLSTQEYMTEPSIAEHNESVIRSMSGKIADYIPGVDYILTAGSPVSILVAGMNLARFKGAEHKILKWNSRDRGYDLAKLKL